MRFVKGYKPVWSKESREKLSRTLKGHNVSEETKRKIGLANRNRPWTEEQRIKQSKSHKGLKQLAETVVKRINKCIGRKRTVEVRKRMSEIAKQKVKDGKCNLYKGGITGINKAIKMSIEFRLWREAVFSRDNWTCQKCKVRGETLHPHHIKAFAYYPELRFAIDNGVTLCKECHKLTDNYANRKKATQTQQAQAPQSAMAGSVGAMPAITK